MAYKRANREIQIFSISALDLFASAAGAFVVVMVVLFPFYKKTTQDVMRDLKAQKEVTQEMERRNAALQGELERVRRDLANAREAIERERQRADAAEAKAKAAQEEARKQQQKVRESEAKIGQLEKNRKTALLGIETKAKSFAIVIDLSGSIKGGGRGGGRDWRPTVERYVNRLLNSLDDDAKVQLIGYHTVVTNNRLREDYIVHPRQGQTVTLNDRSRTVAKNRVKSMLRAAGGGTPTLGALLLAMRQPVEAIILISDGVPTPTVARRVSKSQLRQHRLRVVRDVTRTNGQRREIHAVAVGPFWDNPDLLDFLLEITVKNKGQLIVAQP